MNSDLKAQLRELYITGAKVTHTAITRYSIMQNLGPFSGWMTFSSVYFIILCKSISRFELSWLLRLYYELAISIFQEIDVQGKKAIMIFVPVPQLRAYQKIQTRLVRELEKKFSGKHVVFIAQVSGSVSL